MAKYCFANFQKQKRNSVSHLQEEANREWENEERYKSEVDLERQNIYLKKSENWNEKIDEILEENGLQARSNSVVMTTTIYGFSEEWEDDLTEEYSQEEIERIKVEYFKKCYEFEQTRGECFNFVIHADEEGNWHAHAATVPVTESFVTKSVPQVDKDGNVKRYTKEGSKSFGKIKYKQEYVKNEDGTIKTQKALSAKAIFGNRKKMSDEQTRFYEECGKAFGMERGEIRLEDKPGAVKHLTETEYKAREIKDNAMRTADDLERRALSFSEKIKRKAQEKADKIIADAEEVAKAKIEEADNYEITIKSRYKDKQKELDEIDATKAELNAQKTQQDKLQEDLINPNKKILDMMENARKNEKEAAEKLKETISSYNNAKRLEGYLKGRAKDFDVDLVHYISDPFFKNYKKTYDVIQKRSEEYKKGVDLGTIPQELKEEEKRVRKLAKQPAKQQQQQNDKELGE